MLLLAALAAPLVAGLWWIGPDLFVWAFGPAWAEAGTSMATSSVTSLSPWVVITTLSIERLPAGSSVDGKMMRSISP